jgi:cyclic pyranopterin phosphate synthase
MFDVSHKPDSARAAVAQATLRVANPDTIRIIRGEAKSPKGNVIEAARVSGIIAAKRTSDILPYCHVIPIDFVRIDFSFPDKNDDLVLIDCEVKSVWKTGVEMEALTGATIAALTVYDMVKPADDSMQIGSIKLLHKRGGLSDAISQTSSSIGLHEKTSKKILEVAVLVMSDSRSEQEDRSGRVIVDKLQLSPWKNRLKIVYYKVIPDEKNLIELELRRLCDEKKVDLILTSGGTGIGPRDVTPEATMEVIDTEMKGISEALRAHGQRRTPASMLSRSVAGIRRETIIVNLPGSIRAASESLDVLFPTIFHAFDVLRGYGHRIAHEGGDNPHV